MRLSLFFEIPCDTPDDPQAIKRRFDQALEQCEFADQMGFHAVCAVEHHFLPGYSALPAPEQFLVAAAMRTKRVRLRHTIMHLPFNINHPARIAEHIATLDIISDGRAEFGGGRSTTAEELLGFGVEPVETRPQWEEALKMLPKMWTGELFEWDSEIFKMPPRRITPMPLQKPFPPMWAACSAVESARFAGQNGLGGLGLGVSADKSKSLSDIYREEIARAKPEHGQINNQLASLQGALCLPTDEEAIEIQRPNQDVFAYQIQGLFAPWLENAPPSYEHMVDAQRVLLFGGRPSADPGHEGGSRGPGVVGSPETCAEILNELTDSGYDEAMLFMQMYRTPHDKIMESIELFAKKVKPLLKENSETAPATS